MNEHSLEVLNQYEISVEKTARGRGTYLIWSDKNMYQLFEYNGTDARLGFLGYAKQRSPKWPYVCLLGPFLR